MRILIKSFHSGQFIQLELAGAIYGQDSDKTNTAGSSMRVYFDGETSVDANLEVYRNERNTYETMYGLATQNATDEYLHIWRQNSTVYIELELVSMNV